MTMRRVLAALAVLLAMAVWGCQRQAGEEVKPPLQVTLATGPFLYSGLIALADEKGFFKEAGLNVSIEELPSGLAALKRMVEGKADVATVADQAFIPLALADPSLRIVASLAYVDTYEFVARPDLGVKASSDLRGKRIGVTFGTSGQYYLTRFLLVNAIPEKDITAVNLPPQKLADALVDGEVDAILTWDVYAYETKRRLGHNAVSWPAQNMQDFFWLLTVKQGREDSPEVERLLTALFKAEQFAIRHEDEARSIIQRRWKFDEELMRQFWPGVRLSLNLDQTLVINLEDAAKWRQDLEEGKEQPLPDVTRFIHTAPLEKIDPRAVTIFR